MPTSKLQRLATAALLVLALSHCATTPKAVYKGDQAELQQQLMQLDNWILNGKLAIRTPSQNDSAYLNWQQHGDSFRIRLHGPLGQGAIDLQGGPTEVLLHYKGEERTATNPDLLLQQSTGLNFPVSLLFYWVRGLPSPDWPASDYQYSDGLLSQMSQAGWQVNYSNYQGAYNTQLPGKIVLERAGTRIILLIKQWQAS